MWQEMKVDLNQCLADSDIEGSEITHVVDGKFFYCNKILLLVESRSGSGLFNICI